jgi:hypothetical protein
MTEAKRAKLLVGIVVGVFSVLVASGGMAQTSAPPNPAVSSPAPVAVDPPPAPAQPPAPTVDRDDFAQQACDGFGQMLPSGDGLTVATANILRVGGNRVRGQPNMVQGAAYCDRALRIQASQYPQFWQRQVSFLQARALHHTFHHDYAAAAADIAAADAAAMSPDQGHLRSLRLNTRFIEAFMLVDRGDRAAGEDLAMQTWRARPYTRQSAILALTVIGPDGDPQKLETILRGEAQLNPNVSAPLYLYLFESGAFDRALALVDELTPPHPIPINTHDRRTLLTESEGQRLRDARFWVEVLGRKAFALSAAGQADSANSVIAEMQQRVAAATIPVAPLPERPSDDDRLRATVREQVNLEIAAYVPKRMEAWRTLVGLRNDLAAHHTRPTREQLEQVAHDTGGTYALVETLVASGQVQNVHINPADVFRGIGLPAHDAAKLFHALFDGETEARMQTVLSAWEDRLFASQARREHGDCHEAADGLQASVCDWSGDSTMAISEERAILRAARFALSQNKPDFVITQRDDTQHENVATMYGTPINTFQTGFETDLRIEARAAPTAATPCWRCLDAAAVSASLAPVYIPSTQPGH